MKQISTIIKHRNITGEFCALICDKVDRLHALDICASKTGLKRTTIEKIVADNPKAYEKKRKELSKCNVKIRWNA